MLLQGRVMGLCHISDQRQSKRSHYCLHLFVLLNKASIMQKSKLQVPNRPHWGGSLSVVRIWKPQFVWSPPQVPTALRCWKVVGIFCLCIRLDNRLVVVYLMQSWTERRSWDYVIYELALFKDVVFTNLHLIQTAFLVAELHWSWIQHIFIKNKNKK